MLKYDFEIIYQRVCEMPANFLSRNVVSQMRQTQINILKFKDQLFHWGQDQEPWIKEIKDWIMTGLECKNLTAISYMKNYWNHRFFIDDLLWVRIKIREEHARVSLVLPNHKIAEV